MTFKIDPDIENLIFGKLFSYLVGFLVASGDVTPGNQDTVLKAFEVVAGVLFTICIQLISNWHTQEVKKHQLQASQPTTTIVTPATGQ